MCVNFVQCKTASGQAVEEVVDTEVLPLEPVINIKRLPIIMADLPTAVITSPQV